MAIKIYEEKRGMFRNKTDIPATLRPYYGHSFQDEIDFDTFQKKFKNVLKKCLPDGYFLYDYRPGYFEISATIMDAHDRFIYLSVPDVRYTMNGWLMKILIRTMKNENDFSGGINNYTSLFSLNKDIQKLYK